MSSKLNQGTGELIVTYMGFCLVSYFGDIKRPLKDLVFSELVIPPNCGWKYTTSMQIWP